MGTLYFDDIEVGACRALPMTYEITTEEIVGFAGLWDPRPFHLDEVAAAATVFGGLVACSAHLFAILSWFASRGEQRTATLAALAFDEVRVRQPVRPGDRLSCAITCLEKRDSLSRPDRGVVRSRAELSNQHGTVVFSAVVTTLVARCPR
jgi:acyl dehydratase